MTIIGSFLVVDYAQRIVLKFDRGSAYLFRIVPDRQMRPLMTYFVFIFVILMTALLATILALVVSSMRIGLGHFWFPILITAAAGYFLHLDLVSLYKSTIAPHLSNL